MSGFLKRPIFFLFIFFIAIISLSTNVSAETKEIDATADAYIDKANPSANFGDEAELKIFYNEGFWKDSLIKFDLSHIPKNAIVNFAYFEDWGYSAKHLVNPDAPPVTVYGWAVKDPWSEENVNSENSDRYENVESIANIKGNDWYRWDVTNLTQSWILGIVQNNGIYLDIQDRENNEVVLFSKENPDIFKHPKLIIDFSVDNQPPETVITSGPDDVININQVKITFSGTDNFSPVDALMYSFRLNGGNWSSFSIYNSLTLNKLIPGAYTFEVKARDMMGNEDSSPARRSFSYKEPVPTPYPVKNTLATNILLRTLPKKLLSGQTTKLIGELKAGGNLLSSKQVQIKANGKIIAKIRTNAGGSFSFKHKPKKNTTYQASFEGDGNYRASNSNKAKVKVKKAKKKLKKKAKAKKKKNKAKVKVKKAKKKLKKKAKAKKKKKKK